MAERITRAGHALLIGFWIALGSPLATGAPLDSRLEQIIKRADVGNASVAVHAIDLQTGAEIASYRANTRMIPASNMKIITSGAAIQVLGADFVYRTYLSVDDSVEPPRLVLRGSGDPGFADPALLERPSVGLTFSALMDQLSSVLSSTEDGLFSEFVIDDRVFDRDFVHRDWPKDQLNRWYCAELGGVNLRRNVVTVYAEPTPDNGSPITQVLPEAPWIDLANRAATDRKGSNTAWVARPQQNDRMTLFGKVRTRVEIDVAIHNPPMFAGRTLANEFERRGISFAPAGSEARVRLAESGEAFAETRALAVVTTPLQDVLDRVNQDSHNLYAESLFKRLGHEVSGEPGSWANGATVIRMLISDALGPEYAKETTVSDGSGMSRENRVRPSTLTEWMRWLSRDEERWKMFKSSLASPGVGTLRSRFRNDESLNSELAAKSGYLSGVYALSGVLTHPTNGRQIVFSILLNDVPRGRQARNAKPLHAAIVKELDAYLTPNPRPASLGG